MDQVNICMHDYRGFCMFGEQCDKKHYKDTCIDQECISTACPKRHPRFCYFRFTFGNCKFGNGCRYLHNTPGYAQSPQIVVEMRGNLEEVESLKTKVEYLKEEIKQLREENTAKEILLQAANKTNEILERELEVKVKSVEQSSDKLLKAKNALNEREQVIIELKHKLDLSGETFSALKQHMKDLGDKEDTPTNITVLTSSAKEPPKFKCKYCGKKFSKLTFLEGHIKDYHIPMTTSLRSGQKET